MNDKDRLEASIMALSKAKRSNELRHHLERDYEENRPDDALEVIVLAAAILGGAGVVGMITLFLIQWRWL